MHQQRLESITWNPESTVGIQNWKTVLHFPNLRHDFREDIIITSKLQEKRRNFGHVVQIHVSCLP